MNVQEENKILAEIYGDLDLSIDDIEFIDEIENNLDNDITEDIY